MWCVVIIVLSLFGFNMFSICMMCLLFMVMVVIECRCLLLNCRIVGLLLI